MWFIPDFVNTLPLGAGRGYKSNGCMCYNCFVVIACERIKDIPSLCLVLMELAMHVARILMLVFCIATGLKLQPCVLCC